MNRKNQINEEITTVQVRLLNKQLGTNEVMLTTKAMLMADERGVDLIAIGNGEIPVCILEDYNKFVYNAKKKEKGTVVKGPQLKETRIADGIADNDLATKAKNIDKFLKNGDRAKIVIIFKGRRAKLVGEGAGIFTKIKVMLKQKYDIASGPSIEGNKYIITLSSNQKSK